eukprot:365849-Chlamydomonas_euryale.AAC.8
MQRTRAQHSSVIETTDRNPKPAYRDPEKGSRTADSPATYGAEAGTADGGVHSPTIRCSGVHSPTVVSRYCMETFWRIVS